MAVKPISIEAIEKATGKTWAAWLRILKRMDATKLSHTEIAKNIVARGDASGWWAQSITVAYEQHIGRRAPGQQSDGGFTGSVTCTLDAAPADVHAKWLAMVAGKSGFAGVQCRSAPTVTRTPKRLYWRCKLSDGSNAAVSFEAKAKSKTLVTVAHHKLESADKIPGTKVYWRNMLQGLK
jgi:hypothetical protein